MNPEFEGRNWAIYVADCIDVMAGMPDGLVDCSIFSPPFSDLFVYSDSERDMGNCASHDEFMDHYRFFAESLLRVTKPGRLACVHCTDLPTRKFRDGVIGLRDFPGDLIRAHQDAGWIYHGRQTIRKDPVVEMQRTKALGLLYKQLKKDSAMTRPGLADTMLYFRRDGINPSPVCHHPDEIPVDMWQKWAEPVWFDVDQTRVLNGRFARGEKDEKHICPLQLDVIYRCLTLYSNPGDLILDPFNGIGSTGHEAIKMGRRYIGIELKPEYAKHAARFLDHAESSSISLLHGGENG